MLGQLDLLGCTPPGSARGRTTASISPAYRYGGTPHTGIGHGGTAGMITSNLLVFFVQALGLVLYYVQTVYGVRISDVVLTPSILPTNERCSDSRDQDTCDGMLGQLDLLGCTPSGSARGRTTASISPAYRYGGTPHTGIGHGGTAGMITSNLLVFFVQALGLVLYYVQTVYGVRISDVVLTPSILPTNERCSDSRDQDTCDGMLGQLEFLGCTPHGSARRKTTASISPAYKYGDTPHTGIGHGGTAKMMTSNPLVFFVQALEYLL
ncbi:hypothetical protein V5799_002207 [Amblyomma americanum]|uniref:Uncharacterized protein n=1 Tax=Amblyomma americanum TaxID=6943 RepID=A0AAQ4CY01_AMBAM